MSNEYLKSLIDAVSGIEVKSEAEQIAKYELTEHAEQLQNNWNELKKTIEEKIENANKFLSNPNESWDEDTRGYVLARKFQLEEILKQMQELENRKV